VLTRCVVLSEGRLLWRGGPGFPLHDRQDAEIFAFVRTEFEMDAVAGIAGKIDDLRTGWDRNVAACDALDAVVFDDNDRVRDDAPGAVDQLAEFDDLGRRSCR